MGVEEYFINYPLYIMLKFTNFENCMNKRKNNRMLMENYFHVSHVRDAKLCFFNTK